MAATMIAAAIMILFSQCMSTAIFATLILISVKQASLCSSLMFSSPLIYYSVIHCQEKGVSSGRAVKRQCLTYAAV